MTRRRAAPSPPRARSFPPTGGALAVLVLCTPLIAACDSDYGEPAARAPAEPPAHSVPWAGNAPAHAKAPEDLFAAETLARGRERYDIYCTPCHGFAGDGDGMAVRRGFPAPPSFHDEPVRDLAPEHIVTVITDGAGRMQPMDAQIPPSDRWAIAAYVKALQLSRRFPLDELSEGDKR